MAEMGLDDLAIAVVIPCLDEAATVAAVVADFRAALPTARIYVYDNASTDRTAARADEAGAVVRREARRGKGNVVRRMFADVDADVFVLVDGDGTYPAAAAPTMIAALLDGPLDMVSGVRAPVDASAFRRGHRLGNALITRVVGLLFGVSFRDVLTGYRVLSRRFAKSFPALSRGFEVETEMTVHALQTRLPTAEVEVPYLPRTDGSASKLRTLKHGIAILRTTLALVKDERPLALFSTASVLLEALATGLAWPLLGAYLETGLVERLPTAVLCTGLAVLGALALAAGLILDSVAVGRREAKRLRYLALPPPGKGGPER